MAIVDKIEEFLKRNRYRNAQLYSSDAVLGIDYVVCPASGARLRMIKTNYITNVLGMTVEEYDLLYPKARCIAENRRALIKEGLHNFDPRTGLTRHQIGIQKRQQTLTTINKDGLTGYQRIGQKTKSTHMRNIDEYGNNGYSQLAKKAIIKGNLTKAKNGLILDPRFRDEFYRYKQIVLYLTKINKPSLAEGEFVGIAGTIGALQLDHKLSIKHGYENSIAPSHVAHLANLEYKPWKENLRKHANSDISIDKLLSIIGVSTEDSNNEFNIILMHIKDDIKHNLPTMAKSILDRYYETTN